jgi:uncharacterized protein (DUF362 family)
MAHPFDRPAGPRGRASADGQWSAEAMRADFLRREADLRRRARAAGLSRREFLAFLAAGAAASAAQVSTAGQAAGEAAGAAEEPARAVPDAAPPSARSRVVAVTHPEVVIKDYQVNLPVVRAMLDRALVELTGRRTEAEAWADVAREGDFVAIKHNTMHAPTLHSHPEITTAVTQRLTEDAGVEAARVRAVDRAPPEPYDEFSDPFTLPSRGLRTRLRRLYTDAATAVVNVSVLKTHFGEGLSAALKNHLGSVNNPAAYHGWEPERMPRSLPELAALEPLRTKTRLVVVDAVRPLYAGGPFDAPEYRWTYRGLIVATDPVAADAVGLRILESRRSEARGKAWPMTAARAMVAWGQAIGLGNADPGRIELIQVSMA